MTQGLGCWRCPCGRVAVRVAAQDVSPATAARAMYCLRCGRPTTDFVQIDPLEVPPGVTLGPCVMPEMDEPGRGSYDKDSRR